MKTTFFAATVFLCITATAQPKDALMKWVKEKISKHGGQRSLFIVPENTFGRPTTEIQILPDTSRQNGFVAYYWALYPTGRQGREVFFQLADIKCVEQDWRYGCRCIMLHVDTVRVNCIIESTGRSDTLYTDAWPHYDVFIALPWSRESRLYNKMYTHLKRIAAQNQGDSMNYTLLHERFNRLWSEQ